MAPKRTKRSIFVGEVFGQWSVISIVDRRYCICQCECGSEKRVQLYHILGGVSSACKSCARKKWNYDSIVEHPPRLRLLVHNAIKRCMNAASTKYADYGGRGIKVHPLWLDNRSLFVEYLMSLDGWDKEGLLLDRIDNDGNYEPGNLRFADPVVSANNQRDRIDGADCYVKNGFAKSFRRMLLRGVPLKDLSELYCIDHRTIRKSIQQLEHLEASQ